MSLESEVAALTTATTNLLTAVNVSKATVDQAASNAAASASLAQDQVALAAGYADDAETKASEAEASANNAATAVVSQLNDIKSQTEYARDQALAGLGSADNSQVLANLLGSIVYAIDMALLGVREGQRAEAALTTRANTVDATVATYDAAIENQLLGEIRHLIDLSGMNAKTLAETPRLRAAPASASAAGTQGEWAWDSNFIYVCTALNTWKRVAIATW